MIPPILIAGYYGFENAGDEAILGVLLADLRAEYPETPITVVTGRPQRVQSDHAVETLDQTDLDGIIEAAAGAKLMVLGGGGLLQDYGGAGPDGLLLPNPDSISYYAGFAILGGLVGTPVIIYAIGAGPLDTAGGRALTALACRAADRVTVRDAASKDLLASIGVEPDRLQVTADPVFLVEPSSVPQAEPSERLRIGVSVRPWGTGEWMPALAGALDMLAEKADADIRFIPFQTSDRDHENDVSTAGVVAGRMTHRSEIVEAPISIQELMSTVGECDLLIGMRYHSVILAALTATPVVALAYDPKVSHLMSEMGLAGYSLDIEALTAETIVAAADRAMEDESLTSRLAAAVADHRARARLNRAGLRVGDPARHEFPERGRVTADLLKSRSGLKRKAGRLEWELGELQARYDSLGDQYRDLTAEYDKLLRSKALAPARLYWKLRGRLGRTPTD